MRQFDVYDYSGTGYQKLFAFKSWRVAILNHIKELDKENINEFQAHLETDEAFVLLEGAASLLYLDETDIKVIHLEKNKVFVIKKGVYHSHVLSTDCKLLIIEEDNTADDNSPKLILNSKQKDMIIKLTGENDGIL